MPIDASLVEASGAVDDAASSVVDEGSSVGVDDATVAAEAGIVATDPAPADAALTDGAPADAPLPPRREPDGAPCSPYPSPSAPQVVAGELAHWTTLCATPDGGAPPSLGPVAAETYSGVTLVLAYRNQGELDAYLQQYNDRASPHYQQALSNEEFAARFYPTECDYQAALDWARAHGLDVTLEGTDPLDVNQGMTPGITPLHVWVAGTIEALNAALHVTFNWYERPGGQGEFLAPAQDPSIDLGVPVSVIQDLDSCVLPGVP
jgi:hypothetical protein